MTSIYNFNAGPAILPRPVLERVQAEMLELPGVGMSILEISHRSKDFEAMAQQAEDGLRRLLGLDDCFEVLFLQGGASLQFSMAPLNLLRAGESADYVVTGAWSQKALEAACNVRTARVAATAGEGGFRRIPEQRELVLDAAARYVHVTTNNTIFGTQWQYEPDAGAVPLVADASSDILSRPLDVAKYGLIYAGAQKNIGPSGVTVVCVRKALLQNTPPSLPAMLDYKIHAKTKSLYNTPNTFGIYVIGLVCDWLEELGGLAAMQTLNEAKAAVLYEVIDSSDFFRGHAESGSRSRMNVTFRLPSTELEALFVSQATAQGFVGLQGHRDVGGLRASIYNAFPLAGVHALTAFMREFERRRG